MFHSCKGDIVRCIANLTVDQEAMNTVCLYSQNFMEYTFGKRMTEKGTCLVVTRFIEPNGSISRKEKVYESLNQLEVETIPLLKYTHVVSLGST